MTQDTSGPFTNVYAITPAVDPLMPSTFFSVGRGPQGRHRAPAFLALADVRVVGLGGIAVVPGSRHRSLRRLNVVRGLVDDGVPARHLLVVDVVGVIVRNAPGINRRIRGRQDRYDYADGRREVISNWPGSSSKTRMVYWCGFML